jgi:sulfotransferase family protein
VSPRPNVFLVGDAKCGTTSLYDLFALAPGVGTSLRKELHFFSAPELVRRVAGPGDARIPRDIVRDEATYLAEFARAAAPVVVDVSPSYLQNPPAAARIRAFAPDARIIVALREPAAKVFSQYVHLWSEGRETLPFAAAFAASAARRAAGFSTMFDYEAGGRYAEAVGRYFAAFGRDRVHVVLFEELVNAPAEIARLEAFLGVPLPRELPHSNLGGRLRSPLAAALTGNGALRAARRVVPPALRLKLGQALRRRVGVERPELPAAAAAELRRRYAPDVAELERLLGRPTGWPAG